MSVPRARWIHSAFVLLVVLLSAAYALGEGLTRNVVVLVVGLVPVVVLAVQLVRHQQTRTCAWWFLLAGLSSLTVHNVRTLVDEGVLGAPASVGLGPQLTLALGYGGLLIGTLLVTVPYERRDRGGILDAMIIGLGSASLVWAAVVHPSFVARGVPAGEQAYTLLIILLVSGMTGAVLRTASTSRRAGPTLWYVLLAVGAAYAGIVAGALTRDLATGQEAWWVRFCWIVADLALAAGAAHPAHLRLGRAEANGPDRLTARRLAFLGVALVLNPALVGLEHVLGAEPDVLLLSLGSLLLAPLVLARISGLARLHQDAEEQLARIATHDELTGLPNRRALTQRLASVLSQVADRQVPGAALLFLDLDDFKDVNDEYGHHVGDQLLVAVSHRLRSAVRTTDLVGRFGGDEFVVIAVGDPDEARSRCTEEIERALSEPVQLGVTRASAAASIGAATVRAGQTLTAEQLLSCADAAMYERKRERRAAHLPR
ncbi:MAG TPA: GGDEF domain-containing protein [Actinotalea sp.]|nr:GGDEF domain-containing protein [Actinotalea sp.]